MENLYVRTNKKITHKIYLLSERALRLACRRKAWRSLFGRHAQTSGAIESTAAEATAALAIDYFVVAVVATGCNR